MTLDSRIPIATLGYRIEDFAASKLFYHKALELRPDYQEAICGLQVIALMEQDMISKEDLKDINTLIIKKESIAFGWDGYDQRAVFHTV